LASRCPLSRAQMSQIVKNFSSSDSTCLLATLLRAWPRFPDRCRHGPWAHMPRFKGAQFVGNHLACPGEKDSLVRQGYDTCDYHAKFLCNMVRLFVYTSPSCNEN
jgi:hypothetical protein